MRKKVAIVGVIVVLLSLGCTLVLCTINNRNKSKHKQSMGLETLLPKATVGFTAPTAQPDFSSSVFSRAFGKWKVIDTIGYGYICTDEPIENYVGGTIEICDDLITCNMPDDEYDYTIKYPKFVMRWQSADDFYMERYATYKSFKFEDDKRVPLVEIKSKEGGFGTRFWIRDKNHIVIAGPQYFLAEKEDLNEENIQNNQNNQIKLNENTSNNIILGGELAEKDGNIYFSNSDDDWCLYVRGVEEREEVKLNSEKSDNISIGEDWLFYRDVENHRIIKMSMDGSVKKVIYKGTIDNLIYNKGYLYFLEENEGKQYITRIRSDGSNPERIFSDSICNLILQNNWFYYYNTEEKMIKKVKSDGSSSRCILKSEIDFFVADDSGIYFADNEKQKICRMDFDGSSVHSIIDSYADYLNISDGWIYYWTINDCIYRSKIGTNKSEKYISNNILRFYITDNAVLYDYIEGTKYEGKICQKLIID